MQNSTPLISIITATHNDGEYLLEAHDSVLAQRYSNWEWLIIDNGSNERSQAVMASFSDRRIKVLRLEENVGVSAGRNLGLEVMNGEFFCFLDGDDRLPVDSLKARLDVLLNDDSIMFCDGSVETFDDETEEVIDRYTPSFSGKVRSELLTFTGTAFKGNTWMIRRDNERVYHFDPELTHAEELFFYIEIAEDYTYDFTRSSVLEYRKRKDSAMSDLKALDKGYDLLVAKLKEKQYVDQNEIQRMQKIVRTIMVKSYLKRLHLKDGLLRLLRP